MNIATLLAPERVICCPEVGSKKRALELLSERLAADNEGIEIADVFDSLLARERLGSTGLGHGVAIPHGRRAGIEHPIAALVKIERGIDFDAPDRQPVDLVFALLVPEQSNDEHLRILAALARLFSDRETVAKLREAEGAEAMLELIRAWAGNDAISSAA